MHLKWVSSFGKSTPYPDHTYEGSGLSLIQWSRQKGTDSMDYMGMLEGRREHTWSYLPGMVKAIYPVLSNFHVALGLGFECKVPGRRPSKIGKPRLYHRAIKPVKPLLIGPVDAVYQVLISTNHRVQEPMQFQG
jgi:hypothetical protein